MHLPFTVQHDASWTYCTSKLALQETRPCCGNLMNASSFVCRFGDSVIERAKHTLRHRRSALRHAGQMLQRNRSAPLFARAADTPRPIDENRHGRFNAGLLGEACVDNEVAPNLFVRVEGTCGDKTRRPSASLMQRGAPKHGFGQEFFSASKGLYQVRMNIAVDSSCTMRKWPHRTDSVPSTT